VKGVRAVEDFKAVYERCFSDIYRYAVALCKDPLEAEELTAECFLKALERIDSFRGDGDIRHWLIKIVRNSFLQKKRREAPIELPELPSSKLDPGLLAEAKERGERARALLEELPRQQAQVFRMRAMMDMSFADIGAAFGRSANWACVTYHRVREKLALELERE